MSVNYYLAPKISKAGEQMIRLSVVIYRTRLLTTVGISVPAKAWNQETQSVLLKTEHNGKKQEFKNKKGLSAAAINSRLSSIRNHYALYEQTLTRQPSEIELRTELKKAIGGVTARQRSLSALDYFDMFVAEEGSARQWTAGTQECWAAFRKHLEAQGRNISFSHFTDEGIKDFVRYLRVELGMAENTAQKHYRNLRWFINWAIRKGFALESEIGKEHPKFKVIPRPVVFLTKEELLALYNYSVPANGTKVTLATNNGETYEKEVHDAAALEKTRDMFCFCCFTGLRYSDMANLKRTDVTGGYITITTKKTNDRLRIELLPQAKALLAKYKDNNYPGNTALPVISNQRMNQYLKDLCELCGFCEPITRSVVRAQRREEEVRPKYELIGTHAGRRTFICFALSCGVPAQVVMKWTGHKDFKAMRPYIDVAETVKAEQMKVIANNLTI